MVRFRRIICLYVQIRAIRGDKSSELVPYPRIDKSFDAEARLKAAEPMIRASLQTEGGQLKGGKHPVMVNSYRLDKIIII